MQSVIVFYHKSTIDGKCAAFIMQGILPDAEYIPVDFTNIKLLETTNTTNKKVYILGFPVNNEMWENIQNKKNITYISKQVEHIIPEVNFINTLGNCSFIALWSHLFPSEKLPAIYSHLNTYLKNPVVKEMENHVLGYYLSNILSLPPTLELFSKKLNSLIEAVDKMHLSSIYAEGSSNASTLESLAKHIIEYSISTNCYKEVFGVKCLIVNIPKIFSFSIKETLLEETDTVLIYSDIGDNRYWAIHSNVIDTLPISELFGGFGSSRSSGFTTDQELNYVKLNSIWENS